MGQPKCATRVDRSNTGFARPKYNNAVTPDNRTDTPPSPVETIRRNKRLHLVAVLALLLVGAGLLVATLDGPEIGTLEARGQPLDDRNEPGPVRLAGGCEAKTRHLGA